MLVVSAACALALAAAGPLLAHAASARARARTHHGRAGAQAPEEYGCPILPASDPLNQEVANAPESPRVRIHRQHQRERPPASGLRHQPVLRDPLHDRRLRPAQGADQVHQIRLRIGPRAVPRAPAPRRSRGAARTGTATVTCSSPRKAAARCMSSTSRTAAGGRAGPRPRARSSTCAAARCARKAGPPRTPPGCRSSRCSRATPRSPPGRSTTRCG